MSKTLTNSVHNELRELSTCGNDIELVQQIEMTY